MNRINRRELLKGATGIGAIAVSGCVAQPEDASGESPNPTDGEPNPEGSNDSTTDPEGSNDSTTDPEGSNDSTTDPTDSDSGTTYPDDTDDRTTDREGGSTGGSSKNVTDAPGIDNASIETLDSGCWTDEEEPIGVEFGDDVITITGTLRTGNPCYEAVIESVTAEADQLSVGVGVRSTLEEGEFCVDCLGAISYEARIELADQSGVTTVVVDHTPGDGTTVTQ